MAFKEFSKEEWIDKLLVFMNEQVEEAGEPIKLVEFDFNEDKEDSINFRERFSLKQDDLQKILKICIPRNYISIWSSFDNVFCLTEEGQGRAISVMNADTAPVAVGGDINIGTFNTNAPTQVGHHNTQNIEYVLNNLIEQINSCDGEEEEKQEIKARLRKFLEHPLTQTLITVAPAILEKL